MVLQRQGKETTIHVIDQLHEYMPTSTRQPKQATEIRQASLLDAALQLASQRSPSDITTGDLAQAVGITQGAVFRHFSSKEAIWLAVLDWATDTLMTRLHTAAREGTGPNPNTPQPLAALQAVFMNHVEFVIAYPGIPRIIFQELQHAQDTPLKARVRGLMQQYRKLIVDLLQQAQPRLAPGIDLQAASVLFIGSVQGLVMQSMVNGNVNSMAIQAPGVFAIYLRGLTSRDTP